MRCPVLTMLVEQETYGLDRRCRDRSPARSTEKTIFRVFAPSACQARCRRDLPRSRFRKLGRRVNRRRFSMERRQRARTRRRQTARRRPRLAQNFGQHRLPGSPRGRRFVWMRAKEPDNFETAGEGASAEGFLPSGFWLTGEHVAEMSDSAGTSWLEPVRGTGPDAPAGTTGLRATTWPASSKGSGGIGDDPGANRRAFGLRRARRWRVVWRTTRASGQSAGVIRAGEAFVRPRGHRVFPSRPTTGIGPIPRRPCIRSAMRCRTLGTRWA